MPVNVITINQFLGFYADGKIVKESVGKGLPQIGDAPRLPVTQTFEITLKGKNQFRQQGKARAEH